MIIVRFVLQAKPGKAQELVNDIQESAETMRRLAGETMKVRIMTDLSGPFDTVIQEVELESLAVWEQVRARIFSNPEFQEIQASRENPAVSGSTEFYTLEAEL